MAVDCNSIKVFSSNQLHLVKLSFYRIVEVGEIYTHLYCTIISISKNYSRTPVTVEVDLRSHLVFL